MPESAQKFIDFLLKKEVYGPFFAIIIAVFAFKLISLLFDKIVIKGKTELDIKKKKTLLNLFENILKYLIFFIVVIIILEIYGVNTKSMLAGLGIFGVVLGLALQDTIKDLISGVNILMDDYYVIGDTIEFKGFKGEVISLGLRNTKIKKFSGEVQTFANRNVDLVVNYSQKNSAQLFEISVDYDTDAKVIEKIIKAAIPKIEAVPNVELNGTKYLGIGEISNDKVKYLVTLKCGRMTSLQVRRDVLKTLKEEFDKKEIRISVE